MVRLKDAWREPHHIVLEVENHECTVVKRFGALGLRNIKVIDIRSSSPKSVKHLVELDPAEVKLVKDPSPEFKQIRAKAEAGAKPSIWLKSKGCIVCKNILQCDALLVSGRSLQDETIMYSFLVPSFEAYRKILTVAKEAGLKVNILKMGKFEPQAGVLTKKQERIFWLALKGGYFDYPRKTDTAELAAKLGINPSTLSEIIRRGMRRLLEYYFKNEKT